MAVKAMKSSAAQTEQVRRLIKKIDALEKVLTEIATMGDGIQAEVIDWANIGRNAKYKAKEAIRPRCATCGK